jgi:hypothetical protein
MSPRVPPSLIERAFIWCRPDETFEGHWSPSHASASRARIENFLRPARREFFEEVGAVGGGGIPFLDPGHEVIVPPTQH